MRPATPNQTLQPTRSSPRPVRPIGGPACFLPFPCLECFQRYPPRSRYPQVSFYSLGAAMLCQQNLSIETLNQTHIYAIR